MRLSILFAYKCCTTLTIHRCEFWLLFTFFFFFIMKLYWIFQSKKASAKFIAVTEHSFHGFVYDFNKIGLTAKMYIYGFNQNSTPSEYHPIFQLNTTSNASTVKLKNFNNTILSDEMTKMNSGSGGSSVVAVPNGIITKYINQCRIILIIFWILYENKFYLW